MGAIFGCVVLAVVIVVDVEAHFESECVDSGGNEVDLDTLLCNRWVGRWGDVDEDALTRIRVDTLVLQFGQSAMQICAVNRTRRSLLLGRQPF